MFMKYVTCKQQFLNVCYPSLSTIKIILVLKVIRFVAKKWTKQGGLGKLLVGVWVFECNSFAEYAGVW